MIIDDVDLKINKGEFLTLLGPSGCGKTTLLRLISGFENPDSGDIHFCGHSVLGMAPNLRHVNTVFQSYALFPHMTLYDNIAFGLRCQKLPSHEVKERVMEALNFVELANYSQRKPAELSGGQQQRVAIARAIVNRPLVLLLDEPLSSLDYRLRKTMQIELKQLQRKLDMAFVLVTHDQEEALSMSDRVVVLHGGKVQQTGHPREVYEEPSNLTVAKFIGEVNVFDTTVDAINANKMSVNVLGKQMHLENNRNFSTGDNIHVLVRPEDLRAYGEFEIEATPDMFAGIVEEVIYKGTTVDLILKLPNNTQVFATEFFDEDDENLIYTIGEKVWVHWMPGWEVCLPYEE